MADTTSSTTTLQQDLVSKSHERITLIWELTQAIIAIMVTVGVLWMSVSGSTGAVLNNAFFLIIGFYFSRTSSKLNLQSPDTLKQSYTQST